MGRLVLGPTCDVEIDVSLLRGKRSRAPFQLHAPLSALLAGDETCEREPP